MVVLSQKGGDGQPHIAGSGHGHVVTPGGDGLGLDFFPVQLGDLKFQNLSQGLQLVKGRLVSFVFQPSQHGAVDAGDFRQLSLGQMFCLAAGADGFRKKGEGQLFHLSTSQKRYYKQNKRRRQN